MSKERQIKLETLCTTVREFIDHILSKSRDTEGEFIICSLYGEFQPGFEPYILYKNGYEIYEHMMSDTFLKSDIHGVYIKINPIDKNLISYKIYI